MTQLSLFSADLAEPRVADLGGLLAAHGQLATTATGARVSILLSERWRATAVAAEFARRGIHAEVLEQTDTPGTLLVRSERHAELLVLTGAWVRGAVKAVPPSLVVDAGLLRCWVFAAGAADDVGLLLGLDPHAPDTHAALAAACARAGLAGSIVGPRAGGPALRVVGHRRTLRLTEMVGTLPPAVPPGALGLAR